jgi:hypothetical protein
VSSVTKASRFGKNLYGNLNEVVILM